MEYYQNFAFFYDELTNDVDYKKRGEYILSLFNKFNSKPTLLLDLACGTGSFSKIFAENNIDVIGVEPSIEMLNIAREKCKTTLFLNQCAEELDLYGTVDGAVCLMDSLNHITNYNNFGKALKKVSLFLEKDKLFIFDVNTVYKHVNILANNAYIIENNNVFCSWQNETKNNLTNIYLDFFVKDNGKYIRTQENLSERAYTEAEIASALNSAGLKIEAVYDDLSFNPPKKDSERLFYVTRKE